MFKQWHKFHNLESPEAPPTASGVGSVSGSKEMSKQDMVDFLSTDDEPEVIPIKDKADKDDDDKTDKKKTPKPKAEDLDDEEDDDTDEDDEEEDEDDDLEDLLNDDEPSEDQLESMTPPRRKEILKAFPDLFKKFPYMERAYYREQQFTRIFPDPADAKEAVEKASTLDNFEKDLLEGNIKPVLMAVKEDKKAFSKIVNGYLNTLAEVDEKAYHHIIGNTIKHTITSMVQESRDSGNQTLQQAAQILHQFIFGNSKWTPPTDLDTGDPKKDEKVNELSERERKFAQQRFNTSKSELDGRINGAYRNTIEANIDPKGQMSDYIKKTAVRAATEDLEKAIETDSRFKTIVDKLWEKAVAADFSKDSTDKIRSAFVSKAKTLLPSVIKKARIEALKGIGKRVREDSNEDDNPKEKVQKRESRSPKNEGRNTSRSSGGKIPSNMSTLDYLMSGDD